MMSDADQFLDHFLPGETNAVVELRRTIGLINRRYKNRHMGRSVLLIGETGVGKNHLARVIAGHLMWLRDPTCWAPPGGPTKSRSLLEVLAERFAEVSIPNVPENLVESELFGHVKGAFTGATSEREGFFGTDYITDLLLDEIGEAPPTLQVKLLQVLNDGTYRPVGAAPNEVRTTEARIFFATNRDLPQMVRDGEFRKDLYWRINNLVLHQPPLREQSERIPALAETIVAKIQLANGVAPEEMARLTSADLVWAKQQQWPGNVRELDRLLWLWIYEEGKLPLAEVQQKYPVEDLDREGASIKAIVRQRIQKALDAGERLAETVGDFCDFAKEAQHALYELKEEMRLDREALEKLFGDGAKAAKQISAWGSRGRS